MKEIIHHPLSHNKMVQVTAWHCFSSFSSDALVIFVTAQSLPSSPHAHTHFWGRSFMSTVVASVMRWWLLGSGMWRGVNAFPNWICLRNQHIFKHLSHDRHCAELCSLWACVSFSSLCWNKINSTWGGGGAKTSFLEASGLKEAGEELQIWAEAVGECFHTYFLY